MTAFDELFFTRFADRLQSLEAQRLKLIQERKAYLFILVLVVFLAACCLVSAVMGRSRALAVLAVILLIGGEALRRIRAGLGHRYQVNFREQVTREWFHLQYPGAYLAAGYLKKAKQDVPLEIQTALHEVCIRATSQSPHRTMIVERVLFDSDSYQTWKFVLEERRAVFGGVKSFAVVWLHLSTVENGFVAYAVPGVNRFSSAPDIRFFENGVALEPVEPLRAQLAKLYESIRTVSADGAVRVAISPSGIWAGLRLRELPFAAPLNQSCLDPAAYRQWPSNAAPLVDLSIAKAMASF